MINGTTQEFAGLFDLPGEGFVAQLRTSNGTVLYDRQGLQSLILQRKESGLEARAAEEALARINSLSETLAVQPV
ncbi:MAG: hypothetical protein VYA36_06315 [Pseudomonadota bacterium]|nr:hypothetical protein [Pseudomonadota bacterium]